MASSYVLTIFFYWFFLSAVIFVAGAFALRIFVTGPSGAAFCLPYGRKKCLGETANLIILLGTIFAFVANVIHLLFHASVMTETPLREVFSIIPVFLTKTKYGQFTLIRTGLLLIIALISYINVLKNKKAVTIFGVLISLALLATLSMSGHKGDMGYLNIAFALDMLHVVSISLWIGGLFFLLVCYSYLLSVAGVELWDTFRSMIRRFSNLATLCVVFVLITGVGLSFYSIKNLSILVETPYGMVLVVKVSLVAVIFILGGINKLYLLPAMERSGKDDWQEARGLRNELYMAVKAEAFIGLAVLLATSLLTHLSPEG